MFCRFACKKKSRKRRVVSVKIVQSPIFASGFNISAAHSALDRRRAVTKKGIDINTNARDWAKNASSFSKKLNLIKVDLEGEGICFSVGNVGKYKEITVTDKNFKGKGKRKKEDDQTDIL